MRELRAYCACFMKHEARLQGMMSCVGRHLAPESAVQICEVVLLGRLLLTAASLPVSPCLAL